MTEAQFDTLARSAESFYWSAGSEDELDAYQKGALAMFFALHDNGSQAQHDLQELSDRIRLLLTHDIV